MKRCLEFVEKSNDAGVTHLTHWVQVMDICITKLIIIGSDNRLWPGRWHAIIWTNAEVLLIQISGTTFSEILRENHTFSFKKMHLNHMVSYNLVAPSHYLYLC